MTRKQLMLNSFSQINLSVFIELERIKKPQKHAFLAGRMLCCLVNAFRERPIKDNFFEWTRIQSYVTFNVNKFFQEVQNIKNRLMDRKSHFYAERFLDIKDEFFTGHTDISKSMVTNRNIKIIIDFVLHVVAFVVMKQHGKEDEMINIEDASQICPSEISGKHTNDETPKSGGGCHPNFSINHDN